ncbi:amylo-alpha-1,6-glucosidase [Thiocapsa rosea]|uniref:amylo-alpha-1,6-glucosidase n=1 Tax=Thiocapsa rosea TaxID=69360 RepID=UPI000EB2DB0B|nr:amylo-alpha-1,6-glucosidase [Thiocapsa rosea]
MVTPRIGKPVEINALWYHVLRVMADFAERLGRDPQRYRCAADRTRPGFARFVRTDGMGFQDVIDGADGEGARMFFTKPRPRQGLWMQQTSNSLENEHLALNAV